MLYERDSDDYDQIRAVKLYYLRFSIEFNNKFSNRHISYGNYPCPITNFINFPPHPPN